MKIKIIKEIPKEETKTMVKLELGKVYAVEEDMAHELVEKGVAEYEL
jgi:hypothetical protein